MTLNSTTTKVSYNGDGATILFDVSFKFLANSHVVAILRDADGNETTWTEGSEYSLTGAGDENGGTLTVSTSPTDFTPASGETLVIKRAVPETQLSALPLGGQFPTTVVEQMVDLATMLVQAHSEEIARAIVLSEADPVTSLVLPSVANRAGKFLGFDTSGNVLTASGVGRWRDDWAASTVYVLGDVVRRVATKDLYVAVGTEFTSGSDEATDLTDTTRWALGMAIPSVNFFSDTFTGNGSQTAFTLSNSAVSAAAVAVYVNDVRQVPTTDYTILGATLTFTSAPTNGHAILAVYGNAGAADVADAAITTQKLASNAVTTPKIADGAITAAKIATGAARVFGEIIDYGGAAAPSGWALCDGGTLNRTTHSDLFGVIGTTFGVGDGSTTFNVPDLRGRVTAGVDGTANRLTNQSGGIDGDAIGNVGGAETHTLIVNEMPSHNHSIPSRAGGSTGGFPTDSFRLQNGNTGGGPGTFTNMTNTGGDQPHNNVQPTMIVNKLIFHGVTP